MDKKVQIGKKFKIAMYVLIALGLIVMVVGFLTGETTRTWANLLLGNFYFLSITMGAAFWMAIQSITQSGWSSAYVRIPQAITNYFVVSFVLWIFMFFGLHDIYEWTHLDVVQNDPILLHKSAYLNIPFFTIRFILFFALWIFLTQRIRKLSLNEDLHGGISYFEKIEFTSKVFIFVMAFSFSLFSIDWIMSIDPHWYSTIYAVKKFISAFYHGTAIIIAIVIILHKMGHLPMLTRTHMADFSRYLFALSIIWAYIWLVQYLLIWYANIPEETVYYVPREMGQYRNYFYAELIINWAFPFLFLMWNRVGKSQVAMLFVIGVLMIGQWIELYMSIMPGLVESHKITIYEIGIFLGFAGAFSLTVAYALSKFPVIAKNHPYLSESMPAEH